MSAPTETATEAAAFVRGEEERPSAFVARLWRTCAWCQRHDQDLWAALLHQGGCESRPESTPLDEQVPQQLVEQPAGPSSPRPFPPPPQHDPWFEPGQARPPQSGALR